MRIWSYFIRQSLTNIVQHGAVHLIGLGTMFVSLLIFCTFLLLFVNLNAWVQGWKHSLSMIVYLKDGADQLRREQIRQHIQRIPGAEIKRFTSREQALRDLRGALGSQSALLEGLSVNPLPASFEIAFRGADGQITSLKEISKDIEGLEGVEEVQIDEDWIEQFGGILDMARLVGFIIGGLLCLGVVFIVTNTIKLTLYSRREEIEIMKLVGATDRFVKTPFLLEGAIQGLLSGGLALVILFLGYFMLLTKKIQFLSIGVFNVVFLPYEYTLSVLLLSAGLGFIGSFVALGRFFKV
jgi:cell division transport system permease protein